MLRCRRHNAERTHDDRRRRNRSYIDIADSRPILDWFTRRTYHADDFDVAALAARKAALGVTVSVVLPAHNEEATVAGGVRAARQMHGTLVDQIVVIDDRSSDATARCAAAAGAEVHASSTLVPSFGPSLGKGDVLWRSLTVASGDIVVFVDADIRNPHPRFIWALIAPLLADPRIQLVKAFYDRPLAAGGVMHSAGGGRVTELLARPLLNLFWPALAQVVQPLSGEYAARRGLLEALPFFTGYGSRSACSSTPSGSSDTTPSRRSTSVSESIATRNSTPCRACRSPSPRSSCGAPDGSSNDRSGPVATGTCSLLATPSGG